MIRGLLSGRIIYLLLVLGLACPFRAISGLHQPDDSATAENHNHKGRLIGVATLGGVAYAGTMAGLYQLWYKNYPRSGFHFINDNNEWLYMDKIGHATTAYWFSRVGYRSLRWAGVEEKPAIWIGSAFSFSFLSTIEIFDGFSAEWGASAGDIAFNTAGTALFIGQQFLWKDQKFILKFSYSPTEYPQYNPELLGKNEFQSIIKDYNGQTYWLSANIKSFLKRESNFPSWLNVAVGYGADGMTGAGKNPGLVEGVPVPPFERTSQYYLTLDIDLTRIKTRSETLELLLNIVGFIKIPFPALEYNARDGFRYHWLYF